MTDHEITTAMIAYGGSFVSGLGMLYRRADAENQAILKTAFAHVFAEYAEIVHVATATVTATAPRCPTCGSYQWVYKGDRQCCADCGR